MNPLKPCWPPCVLLLFLIGTVVLGIGWVASTIAAEPPFSVPVPAATDVLRTLKKEHPRLFGSQTDFQTIRTNIDQYPKAQQYYESLLREADALVKQPKPLEYVIPDGLRLLDTSRRCMRHVYVLAMSYRLTGEKKYFDRALIDLRAVCEFKDWNPKHFLDTAEMTHSVAVGYDWLYSDLTDTDKKLFRDSIRDKGLLAAKPVYEKNNWWATANHNWNQVCNGGMAIGALAIAEDEPELAGWILNQAIQSVQIAMRDFAPDGGYVEGPGYWNYGVSYNVHLLSALTAALGTDYGLATFPGFDQTALFRMHLVTPGKKVFAYADTGNKPGAAPPMFWLSKRFNIPAAAWHEREVLGEFSPWHLLYFDPSGDGPTGMATAAHFQHAGAIMMRSSWDSPEAVFVGFKAGSNAVNHSHLELGAVQLEAKGESFFIDLGADDYNIPGYFNSAGPRWKYYRLSNLGHNTLVIDGVIQEPKATVPVTLFKHDLRTRATDAVVDLTPAYKTQVEAASRRVFLDSDASVLIQDKLKGVNGREVMWQIHTSATVKLDKNKATLSQNGKTIQLEILTPSDAVFEVSEVSLDPPQKPIRNVRKVAVRVKGTEQPMQIDVKVTP